GEGGKDQPTEKSIAERALEPVLDLRPRLLDEDVVLHPGGAGGHAGHAPQALVEVAGHRGGQRNALVAEPAHQVDAPAGAVHLLGPAPIGPGMRGTEAAVDTIPDQVAPGHRPQIPPTKRPGASRRAGSSRSFMLLIRGSAAGAGPQMPVVFRSSGGAACSTTLPPSSASRAAASAATSGAPFRGSPETKPRPRVG